MKADGQELDGKEAQDYSTATTGPKHGPSSEEEPKGKKEEKKKLHDQAGTRKKLHQSTWSDSL